MTEEELYNLAEEFANKIAPISDPYNVLQNVAHTTAIQAYIAGYNSRNEEVTELEDKLDDATIDKYGVLGKLDTCKEQVGKLQKPWISTKNENMHPKIDEQIIIAFGDSARMIVAYHGKETFEIWEAHHWMPIPQLPKTND